MLKFLLAIALLAPLMPATALADTPGGIVSKADGVSISYHRRIIIENDSPQIILNTEWYIPECWTVVGPQYVSIAPGKRAEIEADYQGCSTYRPANSLYFIFNNPGLASITACAFVLTGSTYGHHTRLWVHEYAPGHEQVHCFCEHNGRCHYVPLSAGF